VSYHESDGLVGVALILLLSRMVWFVVGVVVGCVFL
jgi:hypothetical protein